MSRIEMSELERQKLARAGAESIKPAGWQPIETAPKDGRDILVIDGDWITIGWWSGEEWCRQNLHLSLWNPTHWMPLPTAPNVE